MSDKIHTNGECNMKTNQGYFRIQQGIKRLLDLLISIIGLFSYHLSHHYRYCHQARLTRKGYLFTSSHW